jgi:hypothetical protein
LMKAFAVVEPEIAAQASNRTRHMAVIFQVHFLCQVLVRLSAVESSSSREYSSRLGNVETIDRTGRSCQQLFLQPNNFLQRDDSLCCLPPKSRKYQQTADIRSAQSSTAFSSLKYSAMHRAIILLALTVLLSNCSTPSRATQQGSVL